MTKNAAVRTVSNGRMSLSFDARTGALLAIRNLETGGTCLNAGRSAASPFAVYHDFHREFDVELRSGYGTNRITPPAKIASSEFSAKRATAEFRGQGSRTRIAYQNPDQPWRAELTVEAGEGKDFVRLRLKVTNVSDQPRAMMAVFPYLHGIRLGDGRKNLMAVNDEAGYIRPLWAKPCCDYRHPEAGGIHGCGMQVSMQWGCAFDEASGDALGFIVEDPDFRNKEIAYDKPSIQVRYFPPRMLESGQSAEFPAVRLMAYRGDWKPTAQAYRKWFTRSFDLPPLPKWFRNIDSHRGAWSFKPGQQIEQPPEAITALGNFMESFEDLPSIYLRQPSELVELCFFSHASMGADVTGRRFAHMDGDNTVRADLGGTAAMREGVRRLHAMGYRFTLYVEGYIINDDADIVTKGEARQWAVTNRDGTNQGLYSQARCLHMCPGSAGWQEHLARTCAALVRETGADGIRLDSLGGYFFPCFNPAHHHESPFDYNRWLGELLAKVGRAVREVNPDCLLMTETASEIIRPHFHGSLSQAVNEAQVTASRDVPTMRVAMPEYGIILHNPHGPVSASLAGFPGGSVSWPASGKFAETERRWRMARFPVGHVLRWGDAAYDNPPSDRADVTTRRFGGQGMDVVVGARHRYPRGKNLSGYYVRNTDIDIRRDPVRFSATVDGLPARPTRVYLVDILNRTARTVSGRFARGSATFEVDANWFQLIVLHDRDLPLAIMQEPQPAQSGRTISIDVDLIGPKKGASLRGVLRAQSLGVEKTAVTLPGPVRLAIPTNAPAGMHVLTLEGGGFLGAKCFLKVEGGR